MKCILERMLVLKTSSIEKLRIIKLDICQLVCLTKNTSYEKIQSIPEMSI